MEKSARFTGNTSARSTVRRALIRSLFPKIVFPRRDLYDKIVSYVRTLNVLLAKKKDIDVKNALLAAHSLSTPFPPSNSIRVYKFAQVVFAVSDLNKLGKNFIEERTRKVRKYRDAKFVQRS